MIVKLQNKIKSRGRNFHYYHFIFDCLFPEIIEKVYKYDKVFRLNSQVTTIGFFDKIYKEVMQVEYEELNKIQFDRLLCVEDAILDNVNYFNKEICTKKCTDYNYGNCYLNKNNIYTFRNYIFTRYKINSFTYNNAYPEIILVKRKGYQKLLNNEFFVNKVRLTTGSQRRSIKNVDNLEEKLKQIYKEENKKFESLFFEDISFKKQIEYFNNAKLIICAHGGVMTNMIFCKKNTTIIEVTCNTSWPVFDKISSILELNHVKCHSNNNKSIINILNKKLKPINKIFIIGFNKCGTRTLHSFFQNNNVNSIHYDDGKLAVQITNNKNNNCKLLSGVDNYCVYSDMECIVGPRLIYCHLLYKILDKQYPNSKFILNTRNIQKWLKSRYNHNHNHNYDLNYIDICKQKLKLKTYQQVFTHWTKEWYNHHQDVIKYFKNRPNDLLVFNIEKDNPFKIKNFLKDYIHLDTRYYKHVGKTKK